MMKRFGLLMVSAAILLGGCAAAPALRPVQLRDQLLAHPEIGAWFQEHSAPAVLATMAPVEARAWPRYRPDMTWDLAKEGYQVRFRARFGPSPRRLEALVDRQSGAVLEIKYR